MTHIHTKQTFHLRPYECKCLNDLLRVHSPVRLHKPVWILHAALYDGELILLLDVSHWRAVRACWHYPIGIFHFQRTLLKRNFAVDKIVNINLTNPTSIYIYIIDHDGPCSNIVLFDILFVFNFEMNVYSFPLYLKSMPLIWPTHLQQRIQMHVMKLLDLKHIDPTVIYNFFT